MIKKLMNILNDKYIKFAIICSIAIILAILIITFEPFAEIPFVYNQF